MGDENKGLTDAVVEQSDNHSEQDGKQDASKQAVTGGSQFKSEEEIRKAIAREAQSQKDKELKPLYERLSRYEKEEQERKTNLELERKEKAELEQWGDTPQVRSFQEERRSHAKVKSEIDSDRDRFRQVIEEADAKSKDAMATLLAIEYSLPDGAELIKKISKFKADLLKAEDRNHMELLALRASLKGAGKSEEKEEEPGKPDSGLRSNPGNNSSDLTPRKKIESGLMKGKSKYIT